MSKFTKLERQYLKNVVTTMSIEKNTDQQMQEFFQSKGIDVSRSNITRIRNNIERSAEKWYNELRQSRYLYLAHQKERIDTIYRVENKLWAIANDPQSDRSEQNKALAEIHKTEVTLSNLYDITRYLTERIEKDGSGTNNESLSTKGQTERVRSNLPTAIPDIE